MVLTIARTLIVATVMAFVTGCLETKPPARLDAPATARAAVLLSYPDRPEVDPAPESVREAINGALGARNVQTKHVDVAELGEAFSRKRGTEERLEILASKAGDAPFVVLVETRVRFYSLLSGRFRWDVVGRVTIAPTANLEDAQSDTFDFAAFLDFDHQDERDALTFVERSIAERTGIVVDRFLRGREDLSMETKASRETGSSPRAEAPPRGPPPFEPGDAIYFVMPDRFHNGVPENDDTVDLDDPQAWHGGDIAGLTAKLDYIDGLGISHLWVAPVWDARDTKFHGHGAFHGYWTERLDAVEPRLGTAAELEILAAETREREIGLLLDMVLNHVGPGAPLVDQRPEWFHGYGGITDWNDPVQVTDYDVHGLPDLNQENPEVFDYLLKSSLDWVARLEPAGFRLDAVKHIPNDFWRRYNRAVAEATPRGFVMLGEVLDGNPRVTAEAIEEGTFNALFDFPLHFALVDVFCRDAHPGRIGAILGADRLYPERVWESGRRGLVTLLDNHNLPRITSLCGGNLGRVRAALAMMLGLRGTPSFTWGTALAVEGASEPANRPSMVWSAPRPLEGAIRSGIAARATHPVLVDGLDRVLELSADHVVLARVLDDSAAVVAWSRAARTVAIPASLRGEVVAGELEDSRLKLAAGEVTTIVLEGDFSELAAAVEEPQRREVLVRVKGAPGPVRVAGSAPEVGAWQWDGAVEVEGDAARFELPVGQVVALKLAARVDGSEVWEARADRFVLVMPDEATLELDLEWESNTFAP